MRLLLPRLQDLYNASSVRPVTGRMRRQIFDVLPPAHAVLDLFGGSGILGLEALARGATHLTYVDQDPCACRALRHYVAYAGLAGGTVLVVCHKIATLILQRTYDLVFIDPPYHQDLVPRALALLLRDGALEPGARVVIKSSCREEWAPPACFEHVRATRCGETRLSHYRYVALGTEVADPEDEHVPPVG